MDKILILTLLFYCSAPNRGILARVEKAYKTLEDAQSDVGSIEPYVMSRVNWCADRDRKNVNSQKKGSTLVLVLPRLRGLISGAEVVI